MTRRLRRVAMVGVALAGMLITGAFVAPAAQAVVVGICTIKANNPHASTHVNGTINGTATITCSQTMQEIYLRVKLEKSNGTTKLGTTTDEYGVSNAQGNAFVQCNQPGTYRVIAEYVLVAPPGYSPKRAASNIAGSYKSVACGAASRSSGTVADQVDSFEKTFKVELEPAK